MPAARGLPQVMLMEGPLGDQGWQVSQPGFVRMLWGWVLVIVLGLGGDVRRHLVFKFVFFWKEVRR